MRVQALKVDVKDVVKVKEVAAPSAVDYGLVPSPFFLPELTFKVHREIHSVKGRPRGPSVTIDMAI